MTSLLTRLDHALAERGITQTAASEMSGHKGIIDNWRNKGRDPSLGNLADVAGAVRVDPGWLAYGDEPKKVPPPNDFSAERVDICQPDSPLSLVYSTFQDSGLGDGLFECLRMTGLLDSLYILRMENGVLKYDTVGSLYIRMLGWDWWVNAPGQEVGLDDPDQDFAYWALGYYHDALRTQEPRRDQCVVASRYTGNVTGWGYKRLIMPCGRDTVLVVNEVQKE